MAKKKVKKFEAVKETVETDLIVEDAIKEIEQDAKEQVVNFTVKGDLIEPPKSIGKQFICAAIQPASKGKKIVIFNEICNGKTDKSKPIILHFDYEEPCPYKLLKRYNLTMKEV